MPFDPNRAILIDVNSFTYGLLNLEELRAPRAYDLRLPVGDVNGDRAVSATDIDLFAAIPATRFTT